MAFNFSRYMYMYNQTILPLMCIYLDEKTIIHVHCSLDISRFDTTLFGIQRSFFLDPKVFFKNIRVHWNSKCIFKARCMEVVKLKDSWMHICNQTHTTLQCRDKVEICAWHVIWMVSICRLQFAHYSWVASSTLSFFGWVSINHFVVIKTSSGCNSSASLPSD